MIPLIYLLLGYLEGKMTLIPIATLIALLLIFPRHHVRMEDRKVNDENIITLAVSEIEVQKHQMQKRNAGNRNILFQG